MNKTGLKCLELMEAAMSGRIKLAWTLVSAVIFAIAAGHTANADSEVRGGP